MTLLEILRQELPKRGGWPERVNRINQGWDGRLEKYEEDNKSYEFEMETIFPLTTNYRVKSKSVHECGADFVTRKQYEAALSATQQLVWDGTGLPPVGAECEYMKHTRNIGNNWGKGTVKYISEYTVVIDDDDVDGEFIAHPLGCEFHPLRTEAERAIDEMVRLSGVSIGAAKILYDAGYRKG